MVKKVILIILLSISFSISTLADDKILVVQSERMHLYEDALKGFLNASNFKIKRVILSELKKHNLKEDIRKTCPPLILAIGRDALMNVREIRDIPIIYMIVPVPQSILLHDENFYGISMSIHPENQLEAYLKAIPELNNIGLIYNPDNTGELAEKAVKAADKKGVQLIVRKAARASDVPTELKGMADKIGAFWMLPDITLMTSESIELLLITSMEKNIPILTFSYKYVEMGALVSVAATPHYMGRQAGELAQQIINKDLKKDEKIIFTKEAATTFNLKVAEKLGIELKQ